LEGCIAFGSTPGIKWLYVILPQRCLTFSIFGGRKMVFDWYYRFQRTKNKSRVDVGISHLFAALLLFPHAHIDSTAQPTSSQQATSNKQQAQKRRCIIMYLELRYAS
jgi:hypothetical protein